MALIFQRLARNFIKNGYFPTDEISISRIAAMLEPCREGLTRICDPCCGEGIALAECAEDLISKGASVFSAGIELNAERASQAKALLNHVVHANLDECFFSQTQYHLLWLNPPYGDRITDQVMGAKEVKTGRDRLEKHFLARTLSSLVFGGVLVYIIPHYVLDTYLAKQLVRSLSDIAIYRLPEDQFKQVVIMGYRRRVETTTDAEQVAQLVAIAGNRELAPVLPDVPKVLEAGVNVPERIYRLPSGGAEFQKRVFELRSVNPTVEQVMEVAAVNKGLWPEFSQHFLQRPVVKRRPCRNLSEWHLSLTLAAGHVAGFVQSNAGEVLLVKGSTHKIKELSVSIQDDGDGNLQEVRTAIDRFVPIIKAIDVTPGSEQFGRILTIK
jgi:hypothetical protein